MQFSSHARKGSSGYIATLILLAVTVSSGTLLYTYSGNAVTRYGTSSEEGGYEALSLDPFYNNNIEKNNDIRFKIFVNK